jgi:hypothetical protein
MSRLDPILSGVSGQYFVAAELSRHGYVSTVTLRNTRGIDVLAANTLGTKIVSIQVKTNQGSSREWMLSEKSDTTSADDLFYVFVNLNGKGMPTFHVVESATVAAFTAEGHKQ